MVQQYNTARGAVEEDEAERALQAAYLQEEEGGGWAEEEWEQAEERQQQPPQRWQAFQGQDDEVGAGPCRRQAMTRMRQPGGCSGWTVG